MSSEISAIGLLLPVRQRERQRLDEIVFQPRVGAGCGRAALRDESRDWHQRGLADERFLVAQCAQRLVETVAVLRSTIKEIAMNASARCISPCSVRNASGMMSGMAAASAPRPCLPVGLRRVEFPMLRVAGIGAMQCTGCLCRSVPFVGTARRGPCIFRSTRGCVRWRCASSRGRRDVGGIRGASPPVRKPHRI